MRKVGSFEDRQELLPGVGIFHWCTNLAALNHPILWFILRLKQFYCPRVFVWMFVGGVDGQVHMVSTLSACLGSILPGMIPWWTHLWPGWQESQGLRRFQEWELPWNHLLFETLRTLRSWCATCAQMMCRDIQLTKRQLRLSWWWEVWGEVCWLVRFWLCLKMAMLIVIGPMRFWSAKNWNVVSQYQPPMIELGLFSYWFYWCMYIYIYIYIIWTYFRQSNMAMENHLFSSLTFPLKLSFSAAIFQPAMFNSPRVSCPDLPLWRWGMHGEGRYEWPDGRAYEGHGWFGLPLEHGVVRVVNVLLGAFWASLSSTCWRWNSQ